MEILNPELHLATLSADGQLVMEMIAKSGKGYVPAEANKEENQPVGFIPWTPASPPSARSTTWSPRPGWGNAPTMTN